MNMQRVRYFRAFSPKWDTVIQNLLFMIQGFMLKRKQEVERAKDDG